MFQSVLGSTFILPNETVLLLSLKCDIFPSCRFEKMISGMYLGEIARIVCLDLIEKKLLFNGVTSQKFRTKGGFLTKFVSDIER